MKNKGFTLLELIGVIVILGVVAVFSIPALTKTFKDSAEKEYNEYVKNITLAAENYFHSETDGIINGKYFIKVGTLLENGYLKKTINPRTNKEISEDATVIISKNEDGTEGYRLIELNVTESGYITDGLLVLYDGYNEPVDGIWNDLSGNGNHGVFYGLDDSYDLDNNSIYLNGSNYISTINNNPLYSNSGDAPDMTVEVIFKKTTSTWGNLIGFGNVVNSNISHMDLWTTTSSDERAYQVIYSYTSDNGFFSHTLGWDNYPLDSIIKLTYSKSGTTYRTYVNNTLIDTQIVDNPQGFVTNTLKIGKAENGYYFVGNVYSVRIYNKALTDFEINNNYTVDKYRFDV